jgi:hypothetical protein
MAFACSFFSAATMDLKEKLEDLSTRVATGESIVRLDDTEVIAERQQLSVRTQREFVLV